MTDAQPPDPGAAGDAGGVRVVEVRDGADGWCTVTLAGPDHGYRGEPCPRCPLAKDASIGAFPPAVFRNHARTAYDLSAHTFGCHASDPKAPLTCAGFLARGAAHNLSVRMHGPDSSDIHTDRALFDSYRDVAVANGVDPDDPVLAPCRDRRH